MLKKLGFKKVEHRESEARLKLQKQLFAFNKCVDHGFPSKPTALAYDARLKLIAVGTANGVLRIVGAPGVEYSAEHDVDGGVAKLLFLPHQGRILSQCTDNSLHMWELNDTEGQAYIDHLGTVALEQSKLKTMTALCLTAGARDLLVGTEAGNIHTVELPEMKLSSVVIFQEIVLQNAPEEMRNEPGRIESLAQQPGKPEHVLIGYCNGTIVLWNLRASTAELFYSTQQNLECLSWQRDGLQFVSAHIDGSYAVWASNNATTPKEQPTAPYGPFPCKSIQKIVIKTTKGEPFIIFSGGMPRASYGDRHSVSVMHGQDHVVYDFTSRVLDFVVACSGDETDDGGARAKFDEPHTLLVLAEEELVAVDLLTEGWPVLRQPYWCSLHSSAVTSSLHVANVPDDFWNKIVDVGQHQFANYSTREWPIDGGRNLQQPAVSKDLLLTGHEDGSVRFWDASSTSLHLLYRLNTSVFLGDVPPQDPDAADDGEEEWPPFRKVGTFDPYSDDPRLSIVKIALCPLSETLVLGGSAGQVVALQFERERRQHEVKVTNVSIVTDRDTFVWKGHEALRVREGDVDFVPGFQPVCVMQMTPPAACTALALHSEWQIVAAGTAHGFGVFDYSQKLAVTTFCTLQPTGPGNATSDGGTLSRGKSLKKSLRESFRRLRRRRSTRNTTGASRGAGKSAESPLVEAGAKGDALEVEAGRPVERQVEARGLAAAADDRGSMVRCLCFVETFIIGGQSHSPSLWVGTNAGCVLIHQLTVPSGAKRDSDAVKCILVKEIQLQHRAPVISVCVLDRNCQPLPAPFEVQHERSRPADMSGHHQMLIVSEEQFKIFSLPGLKPLNKMKLTAVEGSRVRRPAVISFRSRSDERYSETDIVCLTNMGDVHVISLPLLRTQMRSDCIPRDNITGIVSAIFSTTGEGFYQSSPSEFSRFSVSARFITRALCTLDLPPGARDLASDDSRQPNASGTGTSATMHTSNSSSRFVDQSRGDASDGAADQSQLSRDSRAPNDSSVVSGGNDDTRDSVFSGDVVHVHVSEIVTSPEAVASMKQSLVDDLLASSTPVKKLAPSSNA